MSYFDPSQFSFATPAAEIAREAGALLRHYYEKGVTAEFKGDVDIVTEADRASEKLIGERLNTLFPEHGIYGEEGTRQKLDSEYRWYVDPLDGTTNFAHGFPFFCVSMGLEHRPAGTAEDADGVIVAGVIYEPLRDELFLAERGKGAYLNGRRISVSKTALLQESLLSTGFPSHKRHENPNAHFYHELTLRSHGLRRAGAAAIDLAYTAAGRVEGYWEFNLNPWDTAAGLLLVEEAGGEVTRFDGSPFLLDSREILASNGRIGGEMRAIFADMFAGRNLAPIPTAEEFRRRREAAAAGS
ncbi:inositol monophosphatase/fructose-1,6-bisphosphatase family protein [Terriglobus roseus DSM 18391]|uniref:Inositol-1-monophosphatase n=1 Tax=Terriglobus roseus (strain DSM 18391 / NRRL B-41598 / KBS 63) TaxID=926566 RepID=I3ZJM7_TERRK|nr:inositol monophosphatase family protein [Terriglobus roseus]AFL89445.1 inositol monophosphatase/fructose-1,6-bisphosphatase family protein [Terriglobus roseus DSM 18391]